MMKKKFIPEEDFMDFEEENKPIEYSEYLAEKMREYFETHILCGSPNMGEYIDNHLVNFKYTEKL